MRLITAKLVGGERLPTGPLKLVLETESMGVRATICDTVLVGSGGYCDLQDLVCLKKYLEDRPGLMSDSEVKVGVTVLKRILGE